jgi:hypothetical protein
VKISRYNNILVSASRHIRDSTAETGSQLSHQSHEVGDELTGAVFPVGPKGPMISLGILY